MEALKALLLAEREADCVALRDQALNIEQLRQTIAKLRHDRFGRSSERRALLGQLELSLFGLEEDQAEAETRREISTPRGIKVQPFERRKPAGRALTDHLPRERIVYPGPQACPCCGGPLHKLGEDVTETLELVPRQWKVIQHVREKHSCRTCEKISQLPAPSHPIARGRARPVLLAHILFNKYGLHLPLTRQSTTYAREGIELDVSTLADWVGASAATLMPLVEAFRATSSRPSVSILTTRQSRCSTSARPKPADYGSMFAMIGRSQAGRPCGDLLFLARPHRSSSR